MTAGNTIVRVPFIVGTYVCMDAEHNSLTDSILDICDIHCELDVSCSSLIKDNLQINLIALINSVGIPTE